MFPSNSTRKTMTRGAAYCLGCLVCLLMVSIGLIAGGVVDMRRYESWPGTLTKVSNCDVVCRNTDPGGGGGGGGGEKRSVRDVKQLVCYGAEFDCSATWTADDQTYSGDRFHAIWYDSKYSCDNVKPGLGAVIVTKDDARNIVEDVEPVGYHRAPLLLIFGISLTVVFICIILFFTCCIIKPREARFDTV